MDNENNELPKYEPKDRQELGSKPLPIFEEWLEYLKIFDKYSTNNHYYFELTSSIIKKLEDCIILLETVSSIILNKHILSIDEKLTKLHTYYSNNDFNAISSVLQEIYDLLDSLQTNIKTDYLNHKNIQIYQLLNKSEKTYNKSLNILQISNLTGLAAEFELQYKKYNKERIFWFMITLSLLAIIVSKIFEFKINHFNSYTLFIYLSLIISIVLYLNDTLIDDFIKAYKQVIKKTDSSNQNTTATDDKSDSSKYTNLTQALTTDNKPELPKYTNLTQDLATYDKPDPSKYTNFTQYVFLLINFIILIIIYYNESFSSLQLFSVELITKTFYTWQEFIPHLSLYIPIIWLLWFAIKQYHYTTKIMNAYRFKMALSLAYHGYKKECEELLEMAIKIQNLENNKQQKQPLKDKELEYKEYLLKNVLKVISEDPTKRDFQDTHMPWSEIKDVVRIFKSGK